jgi:hypothetical protein
MLLMICTQSGHIQASIGMFLPSISDRPAQAQWTLMISLSTAEAADSERAACLKKLLTVHDTGVSLSSSRSFSEKDAIGQDYMGSNRL